MRANPGKYDAAASQFMRALRGKRSQTAFARRLGYKGNPITDWENGRRYPTAEEALRAAMLQKVDVTGAFKLFHRATPPHAKDGRFNLAGWMNEIRGDTSLLDLAARAGMSRFAVGRWCRGEAKPRLPDFFRIVDAATDRLPDLVALLVPIDAVPALVSRYRAAEAARRAAYDAPWTEAVLQVLASTAYAELAKHRPGFIAQLLGMSEGDEARSLSLLRRAGAIYKSQGRYHIRDATSVDTQGDSDRVTALLEHWSSVARGRIAGRRAARDYFAYNVCTLSAADYERARDLLSRTFREIRAMVAASEPNECIALLNLQLLDLAIGGTIATKR